ncbi:MAG: lipopolysaccharide biosynthesis protein [Bacteroidaceae bacterium]|nr:lipopolysaccharide biosynthesis protein [Bacteroidaceae bacterium]
MKGDLKDKTAKGLMWSAVNNGATQVLNLVFGIVLAHFLTPSDYGVTGVLVIFSTIAANLQDSGFSQALINLQNPTKRDYDSVFWFNLMMSVSLYAILFFCAPLLAWHFEMPCLVEVSRVVFLGFVIAGLSISSGAYLRKNLKNKEIAILSLTALVLSGVVGIVMAMNDMSYWSLVAQQLTYITFITLGRFFYCRWLPSLHFSFAPVRSMMGFGMHMLVTNVVNTLSEHLLTFVMGSHFKSKSVIGNFTQANKWNLMASKMVSETVGQLAQTVLVEVTDDKERELRVFRKLLRFTAFFAMPAMLGLAVVAEEFILVSIGEKWVDCIPMMRILCIGGAFLPLYTLYRNLTVSSGKGRVYLWLGVSQVVMQIAVVVCFMSLGIIPMVVSFVVFQILWIGVWQTFARRYLGMRWRMLCADVAPYLLASLAAVSSAYFSTMCLTNLWMLLISRVFISAVVYLLIMWLWHDDILREINAKYLKKNVS